MARDSYKDEAEIREVVRKFESCEYELAEFTHLRHVTVACWYLSTNAPVHALEKMRGSLQQFISHHGKQGYHETITRFWMELLGSYLEKFGQGATILMKINRALECYSSKDVLFSYYTREWVMSEVARREWVDPDLRVIGESATEAAAGQGIFENWIKS
jgi:hypothetical protein